MNSDRWGLSREIISLLYLRHDHFSCGIFFCLIPLPISQCIAKRSNAISSIMVINYIFCNIFYVPYSTRIWICADNKDDRVTWMEALNKQISDSMAWNMRKTVSKSSAAATAKAREANMIGNGSVPVLV